MRAALGIALILASLALAQTENPTTRPAAVKAMATRPATTAPATRPARANVVLSPERLREYRAGIAALQKEKNPEIESARRKLKADKEDRDKKYRQEQDRNASKAAAAFNRVNTRSYRRRPAQYRNEVKKYQDAQSDAQTVAAEHQKEEKQYAPSMTELARLEDAWRAVREYGIDVDFRQWHQADVARSRAEAILSKPASYPAELRPTAEPVEKSIREDLRRSKDRDREPQAGNS